MSGCRYRILASTAVALILAAPAGVAAAQEAGDSSVGPTAVEQPAAASEAVPGAKYATAGAATAPAKPAAGSGSGSFGLAMIFVLLTYGGWNEAAYLAGNN